MTTPAPIPFNEETAAFVERLIANTDTLELDFDDEAYSDDPADGHPWPKAKAAWAIRARPFTRFQAAGWSVLRSVCGSDSHPLCRQWLTDVHSPVVYAVRKGAGILEGFLDAWRAGSLWTSTNEPGAPAAGGA